MRTNSTNGKKTPETLAPLAPRTTLVLTPSARKQANKMAKKHKRSFSKEVEFLIEQEYGRLFGKEQVAA